MNEQIKQLAQQYPVPEEMKMERRLSRLDRMRAFYQEKMDTAPGNQALMFKGFVSALAYSIATIKMYRKLTKLIAELAKEADKT